jgi:hypothetical protein
MIQWLAAAAISFSTFVGAPSPQECARPNASAQDAARALGAADASFAPNLGEWPEHVLFHARCGAVQGWLDNHGWTLALHDTSTAPGSSGAGANARPAWNLRLSWPAPAEFVDAREPLERGRTRIVGNDPSRWRSSQLDYRRVALRELAPGVALVARAAAGSFEYDLEVAAGADPSALVFRWEGHCGLAVDERGALRVETGLGELTLPPPLAFEFAATGPRPVACSYRLLDGERFVLDARRRAADSALWIDPALHWSTYLGGQYEQSITALELASDGSVVVAGHTSSIDYPTTPGAFLPFYLGGLDAFVSVLSADGSTLLRSTLIAGAGDDRIVGLGLDSAGRAVVAGDTTSTDFPFTPGAFDTTMDGPSDVFVARLAPGFDALEWSTFVGGASREIAGDMALRPDGAPVLVGATRGAGFPTSANAYDSSYNGGSFAGDAFALELAPGGDALRWSTYLGGPSEELAEHVSLDASGAVSLSGMAYGPGFPITFGAFDSTFEGFEEPFVARLDAQGANLLYSTYFGGPLNDEIRALLARDDGSLWIGGRTEDPQHPLTASAHDTVFEGPSEGFASQLAPGGNALLHSTFFGGADEDAVNALHFDAQNRLIVGGETLSADFETTPGAFDRGFDTTASTFEFDAFLVRFAPNLASVDYATYFGGRNPERIAAIRTDAQGVLVFAGHTRGADLPTTSNAFQPAWNITALSEGFVTRLELVLHPIPYGSPKLNSDGGYSTVRWNGFPSVTDQNFAVGIDLALSNVWCTVFSGLAPTDLPYCGGRLRVRPPFTRYPRFKSDFMGYGVRAVPLAPWMVGQTLYFQVWYADEPDAFGCSVTDALQVLVHP